MIDVLIHNQNRQELKQLERASRTMAARLSEDDWNWSLFSQAEQTLAFLQQQTDIDFACLDVAQEQGILIAETVRAGSAQTFIVLVAGAELSPMTYLKPSIMPGGLLLRPYSETQMNEVLREAMRRIQKLQQEQPEDMFRAELKSGIKMIPYSSICFFEARNKHIVLNMGTREIELNGTLERFAEQLPPSFIRCHRSFIVSRLKIDKIFLSKNYLVLENGMNIPLSRSYKKALKELK